MLMFMLFLIVLTFLLIEVSYKKIIPIVSGDLFVGLGNDIKNRLEVPESVVAKIICKCKDRISLMLVTTVSNNLYAESVKARSPTSVDGRDSYSDSMLEQIESPP